MPIRTPFLIHRSNEERIECSLNQSEARMLQNPLESIYEPDEEQDSRPPQHTTQRSSSSKINLPSLYFCPDSYALSYFHPTVSLHCRHAISRTTCLPVVMLRSTASACVILTTLLNRNALPCWPRKSYHRHAQVRESTSLAIEIRRTHPAHDVVIVGQMGFAVFATEDLVGVEIYIVCKAHDD